LSATEICSNPDEKYAERIERLFYTHSDEKPQVTALIDQVLGTRRFGSFLDVGCGPGDISRPFVNRSDNSTLLEVMPAYEQALLKNFPHARVVIESIDKFTLSSYDAILFSHNLYYHPEERWFPLCKRLFESLNPSGSLFVIMNLDRGDWWKILDRFYDANRASIEFTYIPFSNFIKRLEKLGPSRWTNYSYTVRFPDLEVLVEFMGEQALQIRDREVLQKLRKDFVDLAHTFAREGNTYRLNFEATLGEINFHP
jgi:SAM-dependent methyltransferase